MIAKNHILFAASSTIILAGALAGCGGGGNAGGGDSAASDANAITEKDSIKNFYCESSLSGTGTALPGRDNSLQSPPGSKALAEPRHPSQTPAKSVYSDSLSVPYSNNPSNHYSDHSYSDNNTRSDTECQSSDLCAAATATAEEGGVLPQSFHCGDSIRLRAQAMEPWQFDYSCQLLSAQEVHFHEMLNTGYAPLDNDYNENLEVMVFDDADEYETYGSLLFDIDTDNGGLFIEGNPSSRDNRARLFTYEASWLLPAFEIWNLTHEYVHYLDARFNLRGGFADNRTDTHKTVWWIEGLAEYLSKKNHNGKAIASARTRAYRLSEVLATTYDDDSKRIYRWGYLAVRFMFERYPSHVEQILMYFRAGQYDRYLDFIDNTIGTRYDNEWYTWLGEVRNDTGDPVELFNAVSTVTRNRDGGDLYYYIDVPADRDRLAITLTGGYGDADIYARHADLPTDADFDCESARNGNNDTCEILGPDAGRWYIRLKTARSYAGVTLEARYDPAEEEGTPPRVYTTLSNGEAVDSIAALTQCDEKIYAIDVPENATHLRFSTLGGSGDADLYVRRESEPFGDEFDCRSVQHGNEERCALDNPTPGRWYLKLSANSVFTGVTLTAAYDID